MKRTVKKKWERTKIKKNNGNCWFSFNKVLMNGILYFLGKRIIVSQILRTVLMGFLFSFGLFFLIFSFLLLDVFLLFHCGMLQLRKRTFRLKIPFRLNGSFVTSRFYIFFFLKKGSFCTGRMNVVICFILLDLLWQMASISGRPFRK